MSASSRLSFAALGITGEKAGQTSTIHAFGTRR